MADKTYKLNITLSDGTVIDAGNFVAPQGQAGGSATDVHSYKTLTAQGQVSTIQLCASQASKNSIFVGAVGTSSDIVHLEFQCGSNVTSAISGGAKYPITAWNDGAEWLVSCNGTIYTITGTDILYAVGVNTTASTNTVFAYGKEI